MEKARLKVNEKMKVAEVDDADLDTGRHLYETALYPEPPFPFARRPPVAAHLRKRLYNVVDCVEHGMKDLGAMHWAHGRAWAPRRTLVLRPVARHAPACARRMASSCSPSTARRCYRGLRARTRRARGR